MPVFRDNDGPRYIKAFVAHIIVYGVQLITIVFLRIRLMHQNVLKRRAQGSLSDGPVRDSVSFPSLNRNDRGLMVYLG